MKTPRQVKENERGRMAIRGPFENLKIGENVTYGNLFMPIFDTKGGEIYLHNGVSFGNGVYVHTHTHHFEKTNWRELGEVKSEKPTVINEFAYIGTNAQVMPSCKYIGKHSVVAAGSIVTKDIPDYEIWAGNPAKRIKGVKDVRFRLHKKTEPLQVAV